MQWKYIIIVAVVSAVISALIAKANGRNVTGWAVGGFCLPVLAILIVALAKGVKPIKPTEG